MLLHTAVLCLGREGGRAGRKENECSCCCTCWAEKSCWSRRTDEAQEAQYVAQLAVQKWGLIDAHPSKQKPPPNLESPQFLELLGEVSDGDMLSR